LYVKVDLNAINPKTKEKIKVEEIGGLLE